MLEASVGLLWKNTTRVGECCTHSGDPKTQAHLLNFDLYMTGLSVCVPYGKQPMAIALATHPITCLL